jgi:tight adherence protein C
VSRALVLAVLAAPAAAAAIVELAAVAADARGRPRRATPLRAGRALAALGRRVGLPAPPGDLGRRLQAAGLPDAIGVGDVMAVKAGGAVLALLATVPLATVGPGRLGLAALLAAPAAGFLGPDLLVRRRAARRGRAMAAELPSVLELLEVAVGAGLAPARALGEVGRRRHGALAAELRAAAARIELGVPRTAALATLEARCPVADVGRLVAALERTERHGAPLGPALAALAADARARRAQRLRERAARAAPKIQLVVALLLVPAVMLVVGAAMAGALT